MRLRASVLLGLLAVSPTFGQDVKPAAPPNSGVHKMEIVSGSTRTVHFFPSSTSPGERQMYRELERAENEQSYVDNLQALRRDMVSGERRLEAARQAIQPLLYGWSFDRGYSAAYLGTGVPYVPTSYGAPYVGYYGYGAPGSWGYGYGSALGFAGATSTSLGNGIAPDGVIKQELAKVIAQQSTAEYTASVDRQLDRAVASLPVDGKPSVIRPVGPPVGPDRGPPRMATVLLKGGDKLEGRVVYEDADWIVVQTATTEERVRMGDVVRVSTKIEKK